MTIYYKTIYLEGRRFRRYSFKNPINWLPYETPDTLAAFELPSNEIEERFIVSEFLETPLNELKFIWN